MRRKITQIKVPEHIVSSQRSGIITILTAIKKAQLSSRERLIDWKKFVCRIKCTVLITQEVCTISLGVLVCFGCGEFKNLQSYKT